MILSEVESEGFNSWKRTPCQTRHGIGTWPDRKRKNATQATKPPECPPNMTATIISKGGRFIEKINSIPIEQGKTQAEPMKIRKRIGSTTYIVTVHFNQDSKETVEDKLLRLIKREVENLA
jgi:hypothetical protein